MAMRNGNQKDVTNLKNIYLSKEDFMDFDIGDFPYDNDHTAIGEYHCIIPDGYMGNWYDPVVNYSYCGTGPSWIITRVGDKHYIESMRIQKNVPHRIFPTLETGDIHWHNIRLDVTMRRLSTKGMAGVMFNAVSSLNGLVFSLDNRNKATLAHRYKEQVLTIAQVDFVSDCDREYHLTVDCNGDRVDCYIDDELIIRAVTPLGDRCGKVAITADCPTRFGDFSVCVSEKDFEDIALHIKHDEEMQQKIQTNHPEMKLWKKIDLKNFGTSRQVRFGHLTGTDEWFMVLAQMQKKVHQDAYGTISCLTAINLDGNILWQIGEPSEKSSVIGKICADMPFQVYDINDDGKDEVICSMDYKILILNGATGEVLLSADTPMCDDDDSTLIGPPYGIYAYDRLNPDGIRICNFRGLDKPLDILLKDRYDRLYAYDDRFNLMWKYKCPKSTGHCPLPVDIDGDGKDELLVGYTMLNSRGEELWTYDIADDHTDEIVVGKFRGDGRGYFVCSSGSEGVFIGDLHGNIVCRDYIGHAQRVSVARYQSSSDEFNIAAVNYWGHQGIIYLYDKDGNQIWELENELNGNLISPVNWDGNGVELILTNAEYGLVDGNGVRAVLFPDDGHPIMCCEAIDLCGDERDELVVWDYNTCMIYTQADNPKEQNYHPVKFPNYNASNYRGEYSYPDASYLNLCEQ